MLAPLLAAFAAAAPLSGVTIHVDAGHNGGNARAPATINRLVDAGNGVRKACDTTGTQTNSGRLTEAAFTLDVALRLRAVLQARGATVVMTRTTNDGVGPCITERAAIGNRARADAAVSIHADGGPPGGRGFHVISQGAFPGKPARLVRASRRLSVLVRSALWARGQRSATYIGRAGLDVRTDLGGLNLSTVPKVLTELGNMRNARDARLLGSPRHRQALAEALADGLARFVRR